MIARIAVRCTGARWLSGVVVTPSVKFRWLGRRRTGPYRYCQNTLRGELRVGYSLGMMTDAAASEISRVAAQLASSFSPSADGVLGSAV